jgi:hypothetical protein
MIVTNLNLDKDVRFGIEIEGFGHNELSILNNTPTDIKSDVPFNGKISYISRGNIRVIVIDKADAYKPIEKDKYLYVFCSFNNDETKNCKQILYHNEKYYDDIFIHQKDYKDPDKLWAAYGYKNNYEDLISIAVIPEETIIEMDFLNKNGKGESKYIICVKGNFMELDLEGAIRIMKLSKFNIEIKE